jgi:anaerobic dimethyl sulfoxide reductase subunit C
MKEWPLVLFTLATQLACGLALAATVFDAGASQPDAALMAPLAVAIFPVVAVGILFSLAHLGRPLMAWRALANLPQSRLSREIAVTGLFAVLALAYSGLWWLGKTEGRVLLGAITSAVGITTVLATAAIYAIPARPEWNSGWLPTSFLGTTILLGALAPAVLLTWNTNTWLLRLFLVVAAAGGMLLVLAALWMAAKCGISGRWLRLGAHVVAAGVLPIAIAAALWSAAVAVRTPLSIALLAVVMLGVAAGRAALYDLAD